MTDVEQSTLLQDEHPFSADRPITQCNEDLLGRRDLAEALADSVKGWRESDSLVLGIYGRWGTGKTSMKNMVLDLLRKEANTTPHVVEFNPWQWSSQSQIAEAFFREIGITLGFESKTKADQQRAKKWRAYAAYLDFGSEMFSGLRRLLIFLLAGGACTLGSVSFFSHPGFRMIGVVLACICALFTSILAFSKTFADKMSKVFLEKSARRETTLEDTRKELQELMLKMPKPVLVVVDDIDRLTPAEVKLVFQLVKSNADFPNIIYLLLFQRDYVESCLEVDTNGVSVLCGRDYLEKIVNVGIDLPRIEQSKIDRFVGKKTSLWFSHVDVSESERRRFANIYWGALQHFFKDLRAAKRYLSTLDFQLGIFRARGVLDINVVDFLAVEVLRVFEPDVYTQLHASRNLLTRFGDRIEDAEKSALKLTVENLLERAEQVNKEKVLEIIKELFPRSQVLYGGYSYGGDFEEEWYRLRRICHSDVFDRYFLLRIAEGDVSQADIDRVLNAANDKEKMLTELRLLSERGLLSTMMDRLEAYKQSVSLDHAIPFISAFLDIGDELPDDEGGDFLSPAQHAARIIYWFLKQEPNQSIRGELFLDAARESQGLYLLVAEAQSNDRKIKTEKTERDTSSFLLDCASSEELIVIVVQRMRTYADSGRLINYSRLQYLLYRWKEWAGPDEPSAWLQKTIASDGGLREILVRFLWSSFAQIEGERAYRETCKFNLEDLEYYISADSFARRVAELDVKTLNQKEQLAIALFRKMLRRKEKGKPYGLNQFWDDDDDE